MRVVVFLVQVIWFIITLPFRILDALFIGVPMAIIAARWRKRAKVGDRAYFINIMGGRTVGTIERFYDDGQVRFVTKSFSGGSSQAMPLTHLYPAGRND